MNHTVKHMLPAIGAVVSIASGIGDIQFEAAVMDVKSSWGNIRLLVQPVSGNGTAWIELSRLRAPRPHSLVLDRVSTAS